MFDKTEDQDDLRQRPQDSKKAPARADVRKAKRQAPAIEAKKYV